jgi:hypothetical protein
VRLIEFLLAGGKNEFLPTITAHQGFVYQSHCCTSFILCYPLVFDGLLAAQNPLPDCYRGFPAWETTLNQGIDYSPNYNRYGLQSQANLHLLALML